MDHIPFPIPFLSVCGAENQHSTYSIISPLARAPQSAFASSNSGRTQIIGRGHAPPIGKRIGKGVLRGWARGTRDKGRGRAILDYILRRWRIKNGGKQHGEMEREGERREFSIVVRVLTPPAITTCPLLPGHLKLSSTCDHLSFYSPSKSLT